MKICLISPPTVIEFNERLVAESEAARLIFEHAPMGILSLAAVLEQQQVEAEIIDLKDAGVSNRVIDFMINTPSLYPPPPPTRRYYY